VEIKSIERPSLRGRGSQIENVPVSPFKTNDLALLPSFHLMRNRTAEAQIPAVQGIVLMNGSIGD
jgi:hypothetical protein